MKGGIARDGVRLPKVIIAVPVTSAAIFAAMVKGPYGKEGKSPKRSPQPAVARIGTARVGLAPEPVPSYFGKKARVMIGEEVCEVEDARCGKDEEDPPVACAPCPH